MQAPTVVKKVKQELNNVLNSFVVVVVCIVDFLVKRDPNTPVSAINAAAAFKMKFQMDKIGLIWRSFFNASPTTAVFMTC